jgi:hypothetical protein
MNLEDALSGEIGGIFDSKGHLESYKARSGAMTELFQGR